MSRSQKDEILNYLYRITYPRGTLDFYEILKEASVRALQLSEIDAEIFCDGNLQRFWTYLLSRLDEDQAKGISPIFSIVDRRLRRLIWFPSNINRLDDNKIRNHKLMVRSRPAILNTIDLFNDRNYEALGCFACQLLGADAIVLTPPGNEGGIDFFASIKIPKSAHFLFGANGPIRLIGQSKKYSNRVSVNIVKEFAETINEVKNQNPQVERVVPSWFRSARGPIIGWIIAHNGFQSGAQTKAKNEGIILSDSIEIAEAIASSRRISVAYTPENRATELEQFVQAISSS